MQVGNRAFLVSLEHPGLPSADEKRNKKVWFNVNPYQSNRQKGKLSGSFRPGQLAQTPHFHRGKSETQRRRNDMPKISELLNRTSATKIPVFPNSWSEAFFPILIWKTIYIFPLAMLFLFFSIDWKIDIALYLAHKLLSNICWIKARMNIWMNLPSDRKLEVLFKCPFLDLQRFSKWCKHSTLGKPHSW